MNREIKFRAWHKIQHWLLPVRGITFNKNNDVEDIAVIGKSCSFMTEEIKLMQYTGRKDKKDVELYEGDILEDSDGCIWDMFWNDRAVAFDMKTKTPSNQSFGEAWMSPWLSEELVVIGNIYENPGLLEI